MSGLKVSDEIKQQALNAAKLQADTYYANQVDFVLMGMDEPIPMALEKHINELVAQGQEEINVKANIVREILDKGFYSIDGLKITKDAAVIPLFGVDMYENSQIIHDGDNSILICNGCAYLYNENITLGKGENSTVFKATDLDSGEIVVLKRQSEATADLGSLRNENDIACKYKVDGAFYGKGLASLYDNGETSYFLIQKYVPGKTLDKYKAQDPVALAKKLVAAVLDFQQQTEAMHRDLRPENIMVADDGKVFLLDPGAASKIDDSSGLAFGPLGFTPGFTHPFIMAEIHNAKPSDGGARIEIDYSKAADAKYLAEILSKLPKNEKNEIKIEGILNKPEYSEQYEAYALQKVIESIPGLKDIFEHRIITSFAEINQTLASAKPLSPFEKLQKFWQGGAKPDPVHVEPEIKSRAGSSSEASTVSTDSEQARSFWQKLDAKACASAANKKKGLNKDHH